MFAQQRGSSLATLEQTAPHLSRRGRVPQRHGDIARPALVSDAMDGRAAHALEELMLAPGEKLGQPGAIELVADLEVRMGRRARELVPRTHQLAVIAAVDAIAERTAQIQRNGAVM